MLWNVDEDCTAVPGRVKLTIVGISEDGTEVIKFDGREILIKAAAYGSFAPAPDTLSAALAQAQKYGEEAAIAAQQAVESAASAKQDAQFAQEAVGKGPYIGENSHWFLYDATAQAHLDSGISAYGAEGKSPYIGEDGYWYQWDQTNGIYQKTEIQAQGPKGETGGVVSVNGVMPDGFGNVDVEAGVASVFGRSGVVTAQSGDYTADEIAQTASRVFVSPQEKAKWNSPGDIINGTLSVWQRYNASDSTTYTDPDNAYVADRFRASGTGTVKPNERGYGADITGTITMQYWMEKTDFALLPDPVIVYYSVDGVMQSVSTPKSSVATDSDGNGCVFSQAITDQTLDWVSLNPGRPVRTYAQELAMCQRYAVMYRPANGNMLTFPGNPVSDLNHVRFQVILPSVMRTKPTALANNITTGGGTSGMTESAHAITAATTAANCGNVVMVDCTTSGLGSTNIYFLRIPMGGYLLLDAEIY